ncbi:MAG: hypothetical protein PWQ25_1716 [Deferribacteres bacterium]|jgi:membrane-bound metal-dependent hydrolase YbcI (DUF457 family)|nr:hypothetical protein [Deferribacteres bacterium]
MKLASHKAIGVSLALAFGYDVYGVIGVTLGSVLPDVIDMLISGGEDYSFQRVHRKLSHWWVLYTVLVYVAYKVYLFSIYINQAIFYVSIGALLHIICDSLTKSGVPLLNPFKQDFRIGLFKTGSPVEYLLVTVVTTLLLYMRYKS